MFLVAVTNESALLKVAVNLQVLELDDVAAVTAALFEISLSPDNEVSAAAGTPPVPNATWVTYLGVPMLPSKATRYWLNPRLVIWFSCQPESPTTLSPSNMFSLKLPFTFMPSIY